MIAALRRYNDKVPTSAVSPDGLRVAVGFDDGSMKVYSYNRWLSHCRATTTTTTTGGGGGRRRHPFAEPPKSLSSSRGARDDEDDDNDGLFLTQGDNDYNGDDDDAGGAKVHDRTRMDTPIRHVVFDPHSGTSMKGKEAGKSFSKRLPYFLPIASESGNSPVAITDVMDEYTAGDAARVRLAGASSDEHRGGGCAVSLTLPSPLQATTTTKTTTTITMKMTTRSCFSRLWGWRRRRAAPPSRGRRRKRGGGDDKEDRHGRQGREDLHLGRRRRGRYRQRRRGEIGPRLQQLPRRGRAPREVRMPPRHRRGVASEGGDARHIRGWDPPRCADD